jgi:ABC-type Mn2+/Zn2+ transport system ATPase subunit
VRAQDEVLRIVGDIHRQGVTVLVATHDLQQAADTAHYEGVLLLNQQLLGAGPAQAVLIKLLQQASFVVGGDVVGDVG